ncbi:hypothetical protein CALVIDRAFT_375087 [Calocera viscosa TUFC12733]|uniref:Uncharacterized protein n=1 Tax=Calocera viscosa (strain TUFC12733) TaxID=1330018 RepID=A0A167GQ85_CALVF|nr:hypothetical protein CALVIDRAFT_375087 [Calocera viscosa TUFC12733]
MRSPAKKKLKQTSKTERRLGCKAGNEEAPMTRNCNELPPVKKRQGLRAGYVTSRPTDDRSFHCALCLPIHKLHYSTPVKYHTWPPHLLSPVPVPARTMTSSRPKLRLALLCGLSLITLVPTLLYTQRASLPSSLHEHLAKLTAPLQFSWPATPQGCPYDPYRAPGMIHWGQQANETRWVPFPTEAEAFDPEPRLARLEELDVALGGLEEGEMDELGAGERLMLDIVHGGGEWAEGKNVLIIGDSHDRNNVVNFCTETGGKHSRWGAHVGGWCRVNRLNFTIVYWFLYGIADSDYEWFAKSEPPPKTPESRISEMMLPLMKKDGIADFVPDMVLKFDPKRPGRVGLSFQEARYHQLRSAALVRLVRAQYGNSVPMMYRSRHLRATNTRGTMLRIFQLDQGWRAVCEAMGVRVFDWGGKLEGYTDFYDGRQHYPQGPVTWLFGDMLLFYLREAMDPERWWACL